MKIQKISKISGGAILSGGMLLLLALAMVCPFAKEEVRAADAEMNMNLRVSPVIAIGLQPEIGINVAPTRTGEFAQSNAKLSISTNNPTGYRVFMRTSNGKNTLVGTNGSSAVISAVADGATEENFGNNSWGYSLNREGEVDAGVTQYYAVPTKLTQIESSTEMAGDYNLAFAAKVDTTIPSDNYSNSVVVSAVANPSAITALNDAIFMQEMTSQICANSAEGETKQLIDNRDWKKYYVTKLKDGKCWMTQNMAIDFGNGEGEVAKLTPADSDVTREWGLDSASTPMQPTRRAISAATNREEGLVASSWDTGEYVLATPSAARGCGGTTTLETCPQAGFIDVSGADGIDWKPTFVAQEGEFNGQTYQYRTVDEATHTYDPHFMMGNYYSWSAATAGSGGAAMGAEAPESLCPKGWQLPKVSGDYSFQQLFNTYSVSGIEGPVISAEDREAYGIVASQTNYNVTRAPLYFVRSAFVSDYNGGYSNGLGIYAAYNTSTEGTVSDTRYVGMLIDGDYANPGFDNFWRDGSTGASLRCVAR